MKQWSFGLSIWRYSRNLWFTLWTSSTRTFGRKWSCELSWLRKSSSKLRHRSIILGEWVITNMKIRRLIDLCSHIQVFVYLVFHWWFIKLTMQRPGSADNCLFVNKNIHPSMLWLGTESKPRCRSSQVNVWIHYWIVTCPTSTQWRSLSMSGPSQRTIWTHRYSVFLLPSPRHLELRLPICWSSALDGILHPTHSVPLFVSFGLTLGL